MNTTEITNRAWNNLMQNAEFTKKVPKTADALYRQTIQSTLDTLGDDFLNQPVTIELITQTRIAFLEKSIEVNLVTKALSQRWRNMTDQLKQGARRMIQVHKPLAENLDAFLEKNKVTKEYLYSCFGCNDALINRINNGLTLGELFAEHPLVITKTDHEPKRIEK